MRHGSSGGKNRPIDERQTGFRAPGKAIGVAHHFLLPPSRLNRDLICRSPSEISASSAVLPRCEQHRNFDPLNACLTPIVDLLHKNIAIVLKKSPFLQVPFRLVMVYCFFAVAPIFL
jgi:hypothetical protein